MNFFDDLMDYENGTLDNDQVIDLFQRLIDTDVVWSLQGHYGRTAVHLINCGLCHRRDS